VNSPGKLRAGRIEGRRTNLYAIAMAMRLFQIDDLRALVERKQWPCVSLYLPTHRAGRKETQEDPIRLRNAVAKAREQLVRTGYPEDLAAELLAPAADLVSSRDFWLERADGLALSQKRIRFFEATRTSIQERVVPEMLKSIDDLRQFVEAQGRVQGHTMALSGTAPRTDIVFHGQGNIADKATYKADVMEYVNTVCKKLEKYLDAQTAPLVLAAVEHEQAFYREMNSYHHLLDKGILGNPDGLGDEEIHRAAWEIVEPHFAEGRKTSLEHYADLSNTGKTSDRLADILPAACHGRVRTLFIQMQARTWGKFDAQKLSVEIHDGPAQGDVDLIDLATVCVLQNKGMIYALPRDQMPTGALQAALFRY